MSKKCCGMIYSDDEKVCKVCGKPLNAQAAKDTDDQDMIQEAYEDDGEVDEADYSEEEDNNEEGSYDEAESSEENGNEEDYSSEQTEEYEENIGTIDVDNEEDDEEKKDVNYLKKHIEREAILDQIFDDNGYKKNDIIKEEKEKVPYKGAGIFTLILALLGLAFIGVLVYFIILNPYYVKDGEADKQLEYPELASTMDADELSTLLVPYGATVTDATQED